MKVIIVFVLGPALQLLCLALAVHLLNKQFCRIS
jgi:hypothetical protein